MPSLYAVLLCSTAIALAGFWSAEAQANAAEQTAPAALTGAAEAGSQGDSGTSLADEAKTWIGQTVVAADGTEIGTLRDVIGVVSDTSEAGQLVVETADGSRVRVKLQGASSDGETVSIVEPASSYEEEADAQADAPQNPADLQERFEATLAGHAILPAETLIRAPEDAPEALQVSGKFSTAGVPADGLTIPQQVPRFRCRVSRSKASPGSRCGRMGVSTSSPTMVSGPSRTRQMRCSSST